MASHPMMLLAYASDGSVIGTLDYVVQYDANKKPLGLVDFAAHEENGGAHTDFWVCNAAAGSKVWPEWIDRASDFRVELTGPAGAKWIGALVHKVSGFYRERVLIEGLIGERFLAALAEAARTGELPKAVDLRDLVGGPDRPLRIGPDGRTLPPPPVALALPLISTKT